MDTPASSQSRMGAAHSSTDNNSDTFSDLSSSSAETEEFFNNPTMMQGVASPEELVQRLGGIRPINKILVANNGIAAVKCIKSIKAWSYENFGNEKAIKVRLIIDSMERKYLTSIYYVS